MPIDNATLWLFLGTIAVFILTPGPNMIFCVSRALASGPAAGVYAALGVCLGLTVHAVAAGLGLSKLFVHFPDAYHVLRVGGAAYLVWLAWQAYRGSLMGALDGLKPGEASRGALASGVGFFAQGTLNALLSPKAVFFYLVLFPQFLDPTQGNILVQSLFLISIINVLNFSVIAALCLGAGHASQWLIRHPRAILWQQRCVAGVMVALAMRVLFSRPAAST